MVSAVATAALLCLVAVATCSADIEDSVTGCGTEGCPVFACLAPRKGCEYAKAEKDSCGCDMGCGTEVCTSGKTGCGVCPVFSCEAPRPGCKYGKPEKDSCGCNKDCGSEICETDCGNPVVCPVWLCVPEETLDEGCRYGEPEKNECGCAMGCNVICDAPPTTAATTNTTKPKKCGRLCKIFCQYGNVKDSNGCPICECQTKPAPKCVDGGPMSPFCKGKLNASWVKEYGQVQTSRIFFSTTHGYSPSTYCFKDFKGCEEAAQEAGPGPLCVNREAKKKECTKNSSNARWFEEECKCKVCPDPHKQQSWCEDDEGEWNDDQCECNPKTTAETTTAEKPAWFCSYPATKEMGKYRAKHCNAECTDDVRMKAKCCVGVKEGGQCKSKHEIKKTKCRVEASQPVCVGKNGVACPWPTKSKSACRNKCKAKKQANKQNWNIWVESDGNNCKGVCTCSCSKWKTFKQCRKKCAKKEKRPDLFFWMQRSSPKSEKDPDPECINSCKCV